MMDNEKSAICFKVTIRADIFRWIRADAFEQAGKVAVKLVQNENWTRPDSVFVVGISEATEDEEFLGHHATILD